VIGKGPETLLLLGVIHGNEPDGADLLEKLAARLRARPHELEEKRAIIIPVVNPDGLARKTRGNARGVDLNRNFPAESWTPGKKHGRHPSSEPETRMLLGIIRDHEPARILAVHSPLHCVNYDGPARELASEMADLSGYPLREDIGYPTPGSLGSYAGADLGIPTITLELPRSRPGPADVEALALALASFVANGGASSGSLSRRTPAP
jgi:protein MpaA